MYLVGCYMRDGYITLTLIQGSPTKKLYFQCQIEHDNRLSEMGDCKGHVVHKALNKRLLITFLYDEMFYS